MKSEPTSTRHLTFRLPTCRDLDELFWRRQNYLFQIYNNRNLYFIWFYYGNKYDWLIYMRDWGAQKEKSTIKDTFPLLPAVKRLGGHRTRTYRGHKMLSREWGNATLTTGRVEVIKIELTKKVEGKIRMTYSKNETGTYSWGPHIQYMEACRQDCLSIFMSHPVCKWI